MPICKKYSKLLNLIKNCKCCYSYDALIKIIYMVGPDCKANITVQNFVSNLKIPWPMQHIVSFCNLLDVSWNCNYLTKSSLHANTCLVLQKQEIVLAKKGLRGTIN